MLLDSKKAIILLKKQRLINEQIKTSPNDNVEYCQGGNFSLMFMNAIWNQWGRGKQNTESSKASSGLGIAVQLKSTYTE